MNAARIRRKLIAEKTKKYRRKRFVKSIVKAIKNIKAGKTKPTVSVPIISKMFEGRVYLKSEVSVLKNFPKDGVTKEILAMSQNGFWTRKNGDVLFIAPNQIVAVAFESEES